MSGDDLGAVRRSVHDAEQFDSRRSVSHNRDRRVASVAVVIGDVDLVRRAAAADGVRANLQSSVKGSIGSDLVVAPSATSIDERHPSSDRLVNVGGAAQQEVAGDAAEGSGSGGGPPPVRGRARDGDRRSDYSERNDPAHAVILTPSGTAALADRAHPITSTRDAASNSGSALFERMLSLLTTSGATSIARGRSGRADLHMCLPRSRRRSPR